MIIYDKHSCHRPAEDKSRRSESPESTVVQHLIARCIGYYHSVHCLGVSRVRDSASCTKPNIESYCLMNKLCTSYPDELKLSMGLGNSPQLSMSTKCKTKHTRRHREGTRKQVQGLRAGETRASTTRSRRHALSANRSSLANSQTKAKYAQAISSCFVFTFCVTIDSTFRISLS